MRLDRRGVIWLAVAALVLAGLTALVLLRVPVAEAVAMRVLAWRGIEARLDVKTLDLDRAVVETLEIGPADRPSIAARRIEARYRPWGVVRGRVEGLVAEGLEVRVMVDAAGVRLEGLPTGGGGEGPSRPARTPTISIPDARLYVQTPAGEIVGDIALAGGPDDGWTARIAAQPAVLAQGPAALELQSGVLDAAIREQVLTVSGEVVLASLTHGGATARDVAAGVAFTGRYDDAARLAGLSGDGTAQFGIGMAQLDAETAEQWAARLAPVTTGATNEVAGAHLDALRAVLADALREVSANAELSVTVADGRAVITPVGQAALTAASGAWIVLSAASDAGEAIVVDSTTGEVRAQGLSLTADLVDQLDARVIVSEAVARRDRAGPSGEATMTLALAPWTAGELTLAADVPRLHVRLEGGAWRAEAQAELRATGARFGVAAEDLVARLDVEATQEAGLVLVRPRQDALQQLAATRVTAAGLTFESVAAGVAPFAPGGALMTLGPNGADVETRLSDLSAGVEMLGLRWASVLPAAELVLATLPDGSQQLRAYVQAPRLEGRGDGRDAVVQASVVEASMTLAPEQSARLRFEGLSLGGSALPVTVARAAGELDATLVDGRPQDGRLTLTGLEAADTEARPRVVPLTVSADLPIVDGVLAGAATAVDASGRTIVTAQVRHDFASKNGATTVATPRFVFAPNSLQPYNIVPKLQGPLQGTTGAAAIEASFAWDGDGVTSRGVFTLDALAFNMQFGRVEGLSTRFEVADLLNVRTDRPQRIDIGLIDPGVPLADGRLEIELQGPQRMRIASVLFPFADGVITASPAEIDYAADRKLVLLLAQGISLDALAEMFKPPNVVMQGSLSGRLPIEARDRSVFIESGELVSDAPGVISYTGRAGEGIAQQNESTKLAFDALTNFRYDRLVLTLDGDVAGRLDANVHLEGHNPDVLEGYPINFNLNTNAEFANLVSQAFRSLDLNAAARGAEIESVSPP